MIGKVHVLFVSVITMTVCSAQDASTQACRIEAGVFRIQRTDIERIGIGNGTDEIEIWKPGDSFRVIDASVQIGKLNELTFTLNGLDTTTGPEGNGVVSIGFPVIISNSGEKASVTVNTMVTYFEPNDDGTFTLNVSDTNQGMEMDITATVLDKGHLLLDTGLSVTWVDGREKLEGVELDVGRPTFDKTAVTNAFRVIPGQTFVQVVDSGEQGLLLILLKATVQ